MPSGRKDLHLNKRSFVNDSLKTINEKKDKSKHNHDTRCFVIAVVPTCTMPFNTSFLKMHANEKNTQKWSCQMP
ncbi:hypothetical protein evm_010282 [Chilo suppressalis]|nr:hypothetical protein evm_010282 [Chilo suppressalis]